MEKGVKKLAIIFAMILVAGMVLYTQNNTATPVAPQNNIQSNPYSNDKLHEGWDKLDVISGPKEAKGVDPSIVFGGMIVLGLTGMVWCGWKATAKVGTGG
ncbi:MAG: hypothetical protein WA091_02410 [Minisyncoccales bacterium]